MDRSIWLRQCINKQLIWVLIRLLMMSHKLRKLKLKLQQRKLNLQLLKKPQLQNPFQ